MKAYLLATTWLGEYVYKLVYASSLEEAIEKFPYDVYKHEIDNHTIE